LNGLDIARAGDGIAVLTFDRPAALNALDTATRFAVVGALGGFARDAKIAAVIFTGAGTRGYCAGQDVKESAALGPEDGPRWMESWKAYFAAVSSFSKPIIHAINGVAAGAGLETVLMGDVRVAVPEARFIMAEVDIGLPAIVGGHLLKIHLGLSRMTELVLSGRTISAAEAFDLGIVHEIAPRDRLMARARARAAELAAKPPRALALDLRVFRAELRRGLSVAEAQSAAYQSEAIATGEPQQAMAQFLNRRRAAAGAPQRV
jgi:enoyl-CoA hydratase/carnithine racemase